jgi:hypothetical protein
MKPLSTVISHDGRTLRQLKRTAKCAIYELIGRQKLTYGYEVIRIRVKKEQEVFGRMIQQREVYPSDSAFGRLAWSFGCQHRRQAFERYEAMVRTERESFHVHAPSALQRVIRKEQLACN